MRLRLFAFILALSVAGTTPIAANRTVIHVDDEATPGGNGSGRFPYQNLPDAVAAANNTNDDVVIEVAPGDYVLTGTLRIERPLYLRGSTRPIQGNDGWPTGEVSGGTRTRIIAANPAGTAPLVAVGRTDGIVLRGIRVTGFVFQGSQGGVELLLTRVQDYWIDDNVFIAPANFALQSVASSGRVTGNHFSGAGTGAIFAGGYPQSPSNVVVTGNRSVRNTLGGMLLNGASIDIPELGDELHADLRDNDLSENTGNPNQSFGLRVFVLRRDPNAPGATQSSSSVHAVAKNNRIHGNRFGIVLDAGFPYRAFQGSCDNREYSGAISLELAGNAVTGNLVTPALVTFTRSTAALNPAMQLSQFQYLHGAAFEISDRNKSLATAWIDHPAADPFLGSCPGDATNETLRNVLRYNGVVLPNGRTF